MLKAEGDSEMNYECVLESIAKLETEEQVHTYLHSIPTPGGEYLDFTYETITLTLKTPAFNTDFRSMENLLPNLCAVLVYIEGLNKVKDSESKPISITFDKNIQEPLQTAIRNLNPLSSKADAGAPASSSSSYSSQRSVEFTDFNSRAQDRPALSPTVTTTNSAYKRRYAESEDSNVSRQNLSIFARVPTAKSSKDARDKHNLVEKNYRQRLNENRKLAANTLENADKTLRQETTKIGVSLERLSEFISLLQPAVQDSAKLVLEQIKNSNEKILATAAPFSDIVKKMEVKNRGAKNLLSTETEEPETDYTLNLAK